jgi:hypothetical protein
VRILFDQGTPVPLRSLLAEHGVSTAFELGWATLSNGDLLAVAEGQFDVLITTDRNLRHQQNLSGRQLAVLVLATTSWRRMEAHRDEIVRAVASMVPGEYRELAW